MHSHTPIASNLSQNTFPRWYCRSLSDANALLHANLKDPLWSPLSHSPSSQKNYHRFMKTCCHEIIQNKEEKWKHMSLVRPKSQNTSVLHAATPQDPTDTISLIKFCVVVSQYEYNYKTCMCPCVTSTTDVAWLRRWRGWWGPWRVLAVGDLGEWGWPSRRDKGTRKRIPKGNLDRIRRSSDVWIQWAYTTWLS